MVHRVEPRPDGGATVAVDVIAPAALERPLALAYGPLIDFSLRRLARAAEAVSAAPTAATGAGTPSPPAVPGRP